MSAEILSDFKHVTDLQWFVVSERRYQGSITVRGIKIYTPLSDNRADIQDATRKLALENEQREELIAQQSRTNEILGEMFEHYIARTRQ